MHNRYYSDEEEDYEREYQQECESGNDSDDIYKRDDRISIGTGTNKEQRLLNFKDNNDEYTSKKKNKRPSRPAFDPEQSTQSLVPSTGIAVFADLQYTSHIHYIIDSPAEDYSLYSIFIDVMQRHKYIRTVNELKTIRDHYFPSDQQREALALQMYIVAYLCITDITHSHLYYSFDWLTEHSKGVDYHALALCTIDTINWLAWRPLKAPIKVNFYLKVTALRLSHNLIYIPRHAIVFKYESIKSGPGGNHFYVKHSELDKFMATQHTNTEYALHVVFSRCNYTVLDVDVKESDYPDIWYYIQYLYYEYIYEAFKHLRYYMLPLVHKELRTRPMNITMYRTDSKLSVRVSLGLPMSIWLQKNLISSIQDQINMHDFKKNAYMSSQWFYRYEFARQLMMLSIDTLPMRYGGSLRMPHQPKIDHNEKKVVLGTRSFVPHASQKTTPLNDLISCLPVTIPITYDVIYVADFKMPVSIMRPISNETSMCDVDEINLRTVYMQKARITNGELNLVSVNSSVFKVETSDPPFCVICNKQHDGSNRFQHMIIYGIKGIYLYCISRLGKEDNYFCIIERQPTAISYKDWKQVYDNGEASDDQLIYIMYRRPHKETNEYLAERSYNLADIIMQKTYTEEVFNSYIKQINYKDVTIVNDRYITANIEPADIIQRRVTCIRSPMGSGKTELLDYFLSFRMPLSCLWLSARKSYTYSMQYRMTKHGFVTADDELHVGETVYLGEEYILCYIDSIARCVGRVNVLVLDEFMSLIQQIHDKMYLFATFIRLLENADTVIVLDAQLEISAFYMIYNIFKSIYPQQKEYDRPQLIWNQHKPFKNRTLTVYDRDFSNTNIRFNAAEQIVDEGERVGPVFVFISTINQQKLLYDDLILYCDPSDILMINGETPDEEKQRIFRSIKEETSKYKFFLTTSCLTIGVDINTDHFKTAVGVFTRGCASIHQFIQGVHRPRQIKHLTLFVEYDIRSPRNYTTADIHNTSVLKESVFLWTNQLAAYTNLYMKAINERPFSYVLEVCQDMGYQLTHDAEWLTDNNRLDSYDKPVKRYPKPLTILNEDLKVVIGSYGHYLKNTLKHSKPVNEHAEEYQYEDIEPTPQLVKLFQALPIICQEFSTRPTNAYLFYKQAEKARDVLSYLYTFGIPLETVVECTYAYWKGYLFRRVRYEVNQLDPEYKKELTYKQIVSYVHYKLNERLSQQMLYMNDKQVKHLILRDLNYYPPMHGYIIKQLPGSVVTENFRIKGCKEGKRGNAIFYYVVRFDEGFFMYIPPETNDLTARKTLYDQYKNLYYQLRIEFTCCRPDEVN